MQHGTILSPNLMYHYKCGWTQKNNSMINISEFVTKRTEFQYSAFAKLQPLNVSLGKRKTDMCSLCESGKGLSAQLQKRQKANHLEEISEKTKQNLELFNFHRELKKTQNLEFKKQTENCKSGEAIIVMDFKENLRIGVGPVEIGKQFFQKTQVTVLGYVLFVGQPDGTVLKHHVDVLSYDLSHDSYFTGKALSHALDEMRKLTRVPVKLISFWADCGPHFRSKELLAVLLKDIPSRYDCQVLINFFAEGHGKNPCDSHFSHIGTAVKQQMLRKDVKTLENVKTAIQNYFRNSNTSVTCPCFQLPKRDKLVKLHLSIQSKSILIQEYYTYFANQKNICVARDSFSKFQTCSKMQVKFSNDTRKTKQALNCSELFQPQTSSLEREILGPKTKSKLLAMIKAKISNWKTISKNGFWCQVSLIMYR